MLRDGPLDLAMPVDAQRSVFEELFGSAELPSDVTATDDVVGGVPVVRFDFSAPSTTGVLLYMHGGAFAVGNARGSLPLATDLARRAQLRGFSVDYRLAPEHPFPAASQDVVAAYHGLIETVDSTSVVVVGESAGGNLVLALLLALRDAAAPLPAAAAVFSPVGDLTLSGATMTSKADVDPVITAAGLRLRVIDYLAGADPRDPRVSPVFADLSGLPPLLIQSGSHEVLLDDAVRLAGAAARADVEVRLDVVPGVPHVFQGFAETLDEGAAALDRAGVFLTEHLHHAAGSDR